MQKWWKNPRIIGNSAHLAIRSLATTMRIKVHKHDAIDHKQPYLFAFWHGKQFLPSLLLKKYHGTPMCAMVSPSRDGAMLAVYLEKIGYEIIRGSSRDNNIAALISMKKKLEQGTSVGFGIDGPIGPIHIVKPGIVYLAQKCNIPIIPMGSSFSRHWVFNKAWDKFQLPKPFSKAALVMGEPYVVTKDMDLQEACLELEKNIHQIEQQAKSLI